MRAAIIPPEKLPIFDRAISEELSFIRSGPLPIYTGPFAGNFAINEAILDSCDEWRAVADQARALLAEHGVSVEEIDPAELQKPDATEIPRIGQ